MVVVLVLKSWDWVRPSPPPWEKIPTLTELVLEAPQNLHYWLVVLLYSWQFGWLMAWMMKRVVVGDQGTGPAC